MKVIELLKLNRQMLGVCRDVGICPDDVRFIELYNDYCTMRSMGDKVSYIVAVLSTRYHVSERKVYSLLKHYKSECNSLIFGGGVNYSRRILTRPQDLKTRCTGIAA